MINGANFDVTLSALSQEYISTSASSGSGTNVAADVVFVLDMSSSMTTGTDGRIQKMVNATNSAIDIIMSANPNNRFGVYYFNTVGNTLMSMASYISPDTGDSNPANRYISYSGSGSSISVVAGLTKTTIDGTSSTTTASTVSTAAATHTQYGLYTGITALKNDMAAYTTQQYGERLPYVLLFTDGEANRAFTNWYADLTNTSVRGTERQGSGASGTAEIAGLTILTAAKLKDELSQRYQTYNSDSSITTTWFNVGLGVSFGDNLATALLSPQSTKDATSGTTPLPATRTQVVNYTTGTYSAYSDYGPTGTPGMVYANDYIYYASDADASPLNQAFEDLGNLVQAATATITSPITTSGSGSGTATLVFTDVLGSGMELKAAPEIGGVAGTLSGGYYTWSGKATTAQYTAATRTLVWTIPANELPTVQFASRTSPVSGSYSNPNESPISLTYSVGPQSTASLTSSFYSNAVSGTDALTSATYTPAEDNTYYYNIVTDGSGVFVSSSPKTLTDTEPIPDSSLQKTTDKSSNTTSTAAYQSESSWDSDSFVTNLGNNGKLLPVVKIEKAANTTSPSAGSTLTYTITVTNLTGSAISNVVVQDTVSAGLTIGSISDSGSNASGTITWTIASLAANATKELSFDVTIDASASIGTSYSNTAKITSIGGSALDTSADSDPAVVYVSEPGLNVTPEDHTFPTAAEGYGPVSPQTYTIENTGEIEVTGLSVSLGGTDADSFTLDTSMTRSQLDPSGGTNTETTFQVKPKEGLAPGTYTATITISADGVEDITRTVTFTVEPYPPTIVTPTTPQHVPVTEGKPVTLSVSAIGSAPLTYRWQINRNDGRGWVDISGATEPTYTTSPITEENDGYQYRVYVINDAGSVVSETFTLELTQIPSTGDSTPIMLIVGMILLFGMATIYVSAVRKRMEA